MKGALAILAAALALAGCDQHNAAAGPTDAPAEVLPGSASDAMIAYDTVRSQPPLAPATGDVTHELGGRAPANEAVKPGTEPSDAAAPPPVAAETAAPQD